MLELLRRLFYGGKTVRRLSGGRYEYHGHYGDGTATYVFRKDGEHHVHDGKFRYRGLKDDYPSGQSIHRIRGRYEDGRKAGRWVFTVHGNGYCRKLVIRYANGVAEGVMSYRSRGHQYGMRTGYDNCRLRVFMHRGRPTGAITASFGRVRFSGQCDQEGYPDGKWIMSVNSKGEAERVVEQWVHGRMAEHYAEDLRHGHRKHSDPRMLAMVRDVVQEECVPLLRVVHSHSADWDGSIPVRHD